MAEQDKTVLDLDTFEEMLETAQRRGTEVYSLNWDNEWGGGMIWVMRYRKRFFVYSTDDIAPGPYPTLQEALARGAGEFAACNIDITCSALPAERLVKHLECHEPGHIIRINDEEWRMDTEGAVRVNEEE
jgi:hypothetical protein